MQIVSCCFFPSFFFSIFVPSPRHRGSRLFVDGSCDFFHAFNLPLSLSLTLSVSRFPGYTLTRIRESLFWFNKLGGKKIELVSGGFSSPLNYLFEDNANPRRYACKNIHLARFSRRTMHILFYLILRRVHRAFVVKNVLHSGQLLLEGIQTAFRFFPFFLLSRVLPFIPGLKRRENNSFRKSELLKYLDLNLLE